MSLFKLHSEYSPAGDQPKAIEGLISGIKEGHKYQTLLGVTGSGKTYTAANIIEKVGKPTLVIAHNKTLAAQLAQEYRDFFPENAVHYFVSYYDYYQPEAYISATDTYIEKEAQINEEIERLRHASTQALLTRKDVIIVASVSCIYGLGSPEEYEKVNIKLTVGSPIDRHELIRRLISIHYERTLLELAPGYFHAVGNSIELMPVNEKVILRFEIVDGILDRIERINALSRAHEGNVPSLFIFPAKHFITPEDEREKAVASIKFELEEQLKTLKKAGKDLEAERLKRRTSYDLALIKEVGYCNGIENYSRHFSGKNPGDAPDTLLSYFPHKQDGSPDFLTIIDESHVTLPQINGMQNGDASRKQNLIDYGFRLPSARDNRPLTFTEFEARTGQVICTSATPGPYEKKVSGKIVEQIIRPTGLIDPVIDVVPVTGTEKTDGQASHGGQAHHGGQVAHFIDEAVSAISKGGRVIATTLTKKMAEDLSAFLSEKQVKAKYLHSDIKTIERIEILTAFRRGEFDCLVGVNLLREGLDLPEVTLIGILDADKEGFLRSETSLIQIIGRAARNIDGRVILYADRLTDAIKNSISETNRRRDIQIAYNKEHGITPVTIHKKISDITDQLTTERDKTIHEMMNIEEMRLKENPRQVIKEKIVEMNEAVKLLDFETAALLRDEIRTIEAKYLGGKRISRHVKAGTKKLKPLKKKVIASVKIKKKRV